MLSLATQKRIIKIFLIPYNICQTKKKFFSCYFPKTPGSDKQTKVSSKQDIIQFGIEAFIDTNIILLSWKRPDQEMTKS